VKPAGAAAPVAVQALEVSAIPDLNETEVSVDILTKMLEGGNTSFPDDFSELSESLIQLKDQSGFLDQALHNAFTKYQDG